VDDTADRVDVDHGRWALAARGRDVGDTARAAFEEATRLVDVPEDVEERVDAIERCEQLFAARVAVPRLVAVAVRRPVGDEHVDAFRDRVPAGPQRLAAWQVEGPTAELGLPRAPVDRQAFEL
jgi:hypothetical protein